MKPAAGNTSEISVSPRQNEAQQLTGIELRDPVEFEPAIERQVDRTRLPPRRTTAAPQTRTTARVGA